MNKDVFVCYRLIFLSSLLASLSSAAALKPAKIHTIQLTSTPYYTINCSKPAGTCHYVSMLDHQQSSKLVKQFSRRFKLSENVRSKGGRKIVGSAAKKIDFSGKSKLKKKMKSRPGVNIIPYGPSNYPSMSAGITKKDKISDNEILRPEVNFTSNARPAMLKWRELEIEKTQIIKPSDKQKYKSRLKKKYSSRVPIHAGYSRKFIEYPKPPIMKIFQKRYPQYPSGWSITRLPAPSYVNGLPQTIFHLKYPLKIRRLNSVDEEKFEE